MNEQDQEILGLSSPENHRVFSISASESLYASTASTRPGAISTGIPRLDEALYPGSSCLDGGLTGQSKGVPCGRVTEVFGPPGVGKTSLALTTAANALQAGGKVVWIDTGSPLPTPRLRNILFRVAAKSTNQPSSADADNVSNPTHQVRDLVQNLAQNLIYLRPQSLPHLLALLLHPPKNFPPDETTILVIDSVSGPFPSYFANLSDLRSRLLSSSGRTQENSIQWLVNRKWNVTGDLAHQLTKLAATYRMAVLVVNQTHTRVKGQPRPTLSPTVAGGTWEGSIHERIVLYRDLPDTYDGNGNQSAGLTDAAAAAVMTTRLCFAEVIKKAGKALPIRLDENIIPFVIEADGLREVMNESQPPAIPDSVSSSSSELSPPPQDEEEKEVINNETVTEAQFQPFPSTQRKRKVDEIADSQDEGEDEEDGDYD